MCDLSIPPGSLGDLKFNKIFSLYGFHFTPDYKSALTRMYEHLVPGGKAFFMIPVRGTLHDLDRQLIKHPEWLVHTEGVITVPDYAHEDGKDNDDKVKDAFIEVGFEVKEFDVHNAKCTFKNVKEAADFASSMNPFMLLLPKKWHDELEEFYHKYFLETKTDFYTPGIDSPDEPYTEQYWAAHVFAKKTE